MKKPSLAAALLVLAALIAGLFYAAYSSNRPSTAGSVVDEAVSLQRAVEGRAACLPYRDGYADNRECLLGMGTDDGDFYALDGSGLSAEDLTVLEASDRVRVSGLTVPIAAISSDAWARYDIVGIMRVESVEKLK